LKSKDDKKNKNLTVKLILDILNLEKLFKVKFDTSNGWKISNKVKTDGKNIHQKVFSARKNFGLMVFSGGVGGDIKMQGN